MIKPKDIKISSKLLVLFLFAALVPLIITGSIIYKNSIETVKEGVILNLTSQTEFRANELVKYVEEKKADISIMASNPLIVSALNKFVSAFENSGVDSEIYKFVDNEFSKYLAEFKASGFYYDILLISLKGDIVFSVVRESDFSTNLLDGPFRDTGLAKVFHDAQAGTYPAMSHFNYYVPSHMPAAFLAVPVMSGGRHIGVLAAQMDSAKLNEFTRNYTSLGRSGEIVLGEKIGNDAVFINPLRHDPDAAFKRKAVIGSVNAVPIQKAVLGEKGSGQFRDYRGTEVIASWVYIPELDWGMVVKIDAAEAFAPIDGITRLYLLMGIVTLFAVTIIAHLVSRSISRPVLKLTRATELMTAGDLNVRAEVNSGDEVGALGNAFNRMSEAIHKANEENTNRNWLKVGQSELDEQMRGDQQIENLCNKIIVFICNYVKSEIGAMYVVDDNVIKLMGSYAYRTQKNVSNKFGFGEGLVGQAALEKKSILLTDVPEDYIKITSGLGEKSPSNILVIPFLYSGIVIGVIEIGSFQPFTGLQMEFLEEASGSIAIAVNSAASRMALQRMFEVAKQQSEDLQRQQEELRAINEELTEQTETLKESETRLQRQQEELRSANEELAIYTESLRESEARLQSQQEEMEQTNEELEEQKKILEDRNNKLEKASRELELKSRELALTNKYKSEFLANMSHELRTPLNSILILSKLLKDNKEGNLNLKQKEYSDTIYQAGNDLLGLINEVLDLSKIEAGRLDVFAEELRLEGLVSYIDKNFRPLADDKGLYLNVELEPGISKVHTDRQRLEQIIKNLISNALKFTREGGITVSIGRPGADADLFSSCLHPKKTVGIAVSDTGIGIPKEKQQLIFEAFKQADGSMNRKYGGTGLGLTISRELACLLKGEIRVKSSEGKGSTFTLYLPEKLDSALVLKPSPENISPVNPESACGSVRMEKENPPETTPAFRAQNIDDVKDDRRDISPNDKSVLIIEDDPRFAKVLYNLAHEKGFKALIAGEGKTGLYMTDHHKPDAIILDLRLPDMDGWVVMNHLKDNPKTRHIPVHVISAMEFSPDIMKRGAIGYLTKPVDPAGLEKVFELIRDRIADALKKLLVVEDDENERRSIIELVGNEKVLVTAVGTFTEAFDLLKSEKFDCVIMDLGIPDMSGLEFLEKLNNDGNVFHPPVIVYTGRELSKWEEESLQKYTDRIIIKSVKSPERLLDETTLFLHMVESELSEDKQEMLKMVHNKEMFFQDKKVLLVDDDMRNAFALSSTLEEKGMKVLIGKNGREGLDCLSRNPDIDIVLMDIMMPEMDGYEAMKEIRKQAKFLKLPVIALTAKAMRGDREKCIKAGASDYISKPIDTDRLLSVMRVWMYQQ